MMFNCSQCGECCRHLALSPLYADLDDGTGVCRYLKGNLCSIYKNRPLICRVDDSYEAYFKSLMSLEEFYRLNHQVCEILKKEKGN